MLDTSIVFGKMNYVTSYTIITYYLDPDWL